MPYLTRLLPALALVALGSGCGSSPTAPDAVGTPMLSAPTSSSNSSTQDLQPGNGFAPPAVCEVRAIEVNLLPALDAANDRIARELEVGFKGDPAGCPNPTWSVTPDTKLVVDEKQPTRARVYDPGDKFGIVDVTASLAPQKVTATLRLTFPREVR